MTKPYGWGWACSWTTSPSLLCSWVWPCGMWAEVVGSLASPAHQSSWSTSPLPFPFQLEMMKLTLEYIWKPSEHGWASVSLNPWMAMSTGSGPHYDLLTCPVLLCEQKLTFHRLCAILCFEIDHFSEHLNTIKRLGKPHDSLIIDYVTLLSSIKIINSQSKFLVQKYNCYRENLLSYIMLDSLENSWEFILWGQPVIK